MDELLQAVDDLLVKYVDVVLKGIQGGEDRCVLMSSTEFKSVKTGEY